MPENILIAIAWPYANAEIHVGNLTGSHLPGDIVARYHRLKGDNVLMVSGTDSHGTPVTLAADKEGRPVEEVKEGSGWVVEAGGNPLVIVCQPGPILSGSEGFVSN